MGNTERIGNPSREKWTAFLKSAWEQGYITREEFDTRIEIILAAQTQEQIEKALTGLTSYRTQWGTGWAALENRGLAARNEIVPHIPPESPAVYPDRWTIGDTLILIGIIGFIFLPWVLFALSLSHVI